ncbi:MAG: aminotransferase class I/II-fold pyridoxal phosphate-dependent enzyme [Chloroflexota bacterium]|nr:aminotransferase class I/II-fold pyridoxal phosphate-dependent enzyme [Chloroflexota bacterium]
MSKEPPSTLARSLARRVAALPDVIEPVVDMPESVSESVLRAAFDALDTGQTHYTDRPGILPLREQAVEQIGRRYGVELSADAVTITCGAVEARFVAIKQLVKPGQRIVCLDPAPIVGAAALCGVEITTDPTDDTIALLYLSVSDDPEAVTKIVRVANKRDWWVIWDTSSGEPSKAQPDESAAFHPAQLPKLTPRTITIHEAQPMSGWRVGWMAGSKAATKLRAYKQSMTICTTSISQWAALGLDES